MDWEEWVEETMKVLKTIREQGWGRQSQETRNQQGEGRASEEVQLEKMGKKAEGWREMPRKQGELGEREEEQAQIGVERARQARKERQFAGAQRQGETQDRGSKRGPLVGRGSSFKLWTGDSPG